MANWTKELFVDNPELFLGVLEDKVDGAAEETDNLLSRLSAVGIESERVMDLACGIGRHSLELAKRGIDMEGVDISKKYIEIAKDQGQKQGLEDRARFKVGDMRNIADIYEQGSFDGILNLFTSFGYYDDETNRDILRQCATLVREGGFFVLEMRNRDWLLNNFDDKSYQIYKDWVVLEQRDFNFKNSRVYNTWRFFEKDKNEYKMAKEINVDHRVWSMHELIDLFEETSWKVEDIGPGLRVDKPEVLGMASELMVVAKKS